MLPKAPRILYFIGGSMPTEEQQRDAMRFGANCVFRNGRFAPTEGATEPCDGVAGQVPDLYKKLPDGATVYAAYLEKTNALSLAVTVTPPAPETPAAPPALVPVVPVAPVIPAAPAAPDASGWGQQPPPPPPAA